MSAPHARKTSERSDDIPLILDQGWLKKTESFLAFFSQPNVKPILPWLSNC